MKRRESGFRGGTGIASILMIFVVLCLTTFGVLSYSSARADERLTDKNITHVLSYYEADAKAQEILMQIDERLYALKKASIDQNSYEKNLNEEFENRSDLIVLILGEDGRNQISYEIGINEQQSLQVEIKILPWDSLKRYEVVRYKLEEKDIWGEDGLTIEEEDTGLWQGNGS